MLISVVIPVFNAEKTIAPLCRSLIAEIGAEYELDIILVDDNSGDNSELSCIQLQTEHPDQVTYLRLSRNFGEHNAAMAGLHYALGEYVVTMDDDLQNPPAEVAKLLAEVKKGYDIVYAQFEDRQDPRMRRAASRLHGWLSRVFLHKPDTLSLSTFRVMSRFLYREIIKYSGPMPYIDAIVLRLTNNIGTVAVRHFARRSGRSNYTLAKLFALWGNAIVSYSLVPLRVIGMLGLVLIAFGTVGGGWMVFNALHPRLDSPTNFERLIAMMTLYRGLSLLSVSIVGEYVGRNFLHLNRDPQFVIRLALPAAGHEKRQVPCPPARP